MLYNSNTLFQKMPDKVSFFYAQMAEKWLELSLKKFHSYIFRNNVESETVLYLTNGRKRGDSPLFLFLSLVKSHTDVIQDKQGIQNPNHDMHIFNLAFDNLCQSISQETNCNPLSD